MRCWSLYRLPNLLYKSEYAGMRILVTQTYKPVLTEVSQRVLKTNKLPKKQRVFKIEFTFFVPGKARAMELTRFWEGTGDDVSGTCQICAELFQNGSNVGPMKYTLC
jgi:hypothetical protein